LPDPIQAVIEHPAESPSPGPRRAAAGAAKSVRSRIITIVQVALGLGVLGWLLASGVIDWQIIGRLLDTGWVLPAAAGLCATSFVFAALRLRVLLEAQGLRLTFASAFQLTVTAVFFSWCIPGGTGGDLVKMYFLGRQNPGRITEAVTITLWDRAIGLATFLILALIAAAFAPSLVRSKPILTYLLFTCAIALTVGAIGLSLALYTDWSTRWPLCRLRGFGRPGESLLRVFHVVHHYRARPGALLSSVAWSLCAQGCLLASALIIASVVVDGGARPIMLALMPLGYVANALPLTPGGLGIGEAAFEQLFRFAGLSGGADVAISWRAVAMLMSLPGVYFYLRIRKTLPNTVPPGPVADHVPASTCPPRNAAAGLEIAIPPPSTMSSEYPMAAGQCSGDSSGTTPRARPAASATGSPVHVPLGSPDSRRRGVECSDD
jgi:hypothetical protein